MATDPTISLQAGRSPQAGEAGGGIAQQPNLLTNPVALNALMTMGGNLAAGRAMQAAITPDGQFAPEVFAQNIKNSGEQGAITALPAMEKGLTLARQQLDQAQIQRQNVQAATTSLLLDPKFRDPKQADYAFDQYQKQVTNLVKQGNLSPVRGVNELASVPMDPVTGKMDTAATVQRLEEHLYQSLPQDQQKNLQYGDTGFLETPNGYYPFRKNQRGGIDFGQLIPKGLSPESQIAPQPTTPTPAGAQQIIPGAARAQQLGVPVNPQPPAGTALPNPLSPSAASAVPGTGRYAPSPDVAKFLAAASSKNFDEARQIYQTMPDDDKAKLQGYIRAKQPVK